MRLGSAASHVDMDDVESARATSKDGCTAQVVPRDAVPANYFTMSASGVVEIVNVDRSGNHVDPPQSTFLPLSSWLHELTAYNLMRRLPLFKTYLPRKIFRTWRNAAHASTFSRARSAMLNNLFYAKPAFVSLLTDVSRLICGALACPLMPLQGPKQVCRVTLACSILCLALFHVYVLQS
jgi:hypothetical protein